jgi:hypothetical protein
VIIELGFSPDQSRQINHLADGQSFGDGQARFIQELGFLQVRECLPKRLLWHVRNGLEERKRHILPDNGGGLEQALVLGQQPVDACRQDRLRRRRDLQRVYRLRQPIGSPLPRQDPRLHEGPHALLQEKGISLRPRDQRPLEQVESPILAQQPIQQLFGTRGR